MWAVAVVRLCVRSLVLARVVGCWRGMRDQVRRGCTELISGVVHASCMCSWPGDWCVLVRVEGQGFLSCSREAMHAPVARGCG